ncbi:unnamed protein product [Mycetohabitans rhizoxinica HKI 454]|uniref:Uncharacterized protein n=1 Tax=Mycetohabitans rhizoxinica (strain DSM 19002 / CIP 109453 / HKI 454) TaxID=882378 RepID=E5AQW2_MYCRK|nr:unnamed protein product [Mycetohabitans rhizoxinica HKI 454]
MVLVWHWQRDRFKGRRQPGRQAPRLRRPVTLPYIGRNVYDGSHAQVSHEVHARLRPSVRGVGRRVTRRRPQEAGVRGVVPAVHSRRATATVGPPSCRTVVPVAHAARRLQWVDSDMMR